MQAERDNLPGVLVVDDDHITRRALVRLLGSRGYEVAEAESGAQALKTLARPDAPRMAVVDWNMGTINGPELCRILRGRSPYVYVVLMTAGEGRKPLVEAMNSGADGYMQKPIDADELEAWLVAGQRIVALQDRLLKVQAELERRAAHDALTGVRNRDGLSEVLNKELSRSARTGVPLGIVLMDLDHFKAINDTHGHLVGDEVLVEFARRCVMRDYDGFGRYGGEEFLAIVPGAGPREIELVAERFVQRIGNHTFQTTAGPLRVTVSAGCASTAQGFADQDGLLEAADAALYDAKRSGRACVRMAAVRFTPDPDAFPDSERATLKQPDT